MCEYRYRPIAGFRKSRYLVRKSKIIKNEANREQSVMCQVIRPSGRGVDPLPTGGVQMRTPARYA